MPNHVHGVILLRGIPRRDEVTSSLQESSLRDVSETEPQSQRPIIKGSPKLGQIIAFYKYRSTKLINVKSNTPGERFWQRNYFEHIIRDGNDLDRIQTYISNNVGKWSEDKENPENRPLKISWRASTLKKNIL
jgi:putative transposase